MDFKNEEAFGLTVIIIAIVFALVLAGAGLHFLDRSILDDKSDELSRSAAGIGLSRAIKEIQNKVGSDTAGVSFPATTELFPVGSSTSGSKLKDYFGDISITIVDTSSRINLNGPDVLTARLLNNLLRIVKLEDDGIFIGLNSRGIEYACDLDGTIAKDESNENNNLGTTTPMTDDADAVLIVKHRKSLPGKRFQSVDQLLDVVRPGTSEPPVCPEPLPELTPNPPLERKAGFIFGNRDPVLMGSYTIVTDNLDEFERLREFVTVTGWIDESTVKQAPLASNPSGLESESRYPVNLNAAKKEVLHAVIATGFENPNNATFDAVKILAEGIISDREENPFTSWKEFEDYMDNKIGTDTPKIDPVLLDNKARLITQLVPNTRLQRFNPNRALIRSLDKTHIGTPTTELSLSHSGYYEIDVLAVVKEAGPKKGADGSLLVDDEWYSLVHNLKGTSTAGNEVGRRRITAVVKVMDILRHTTQTDFEGYGTSTPSPWFNTRSLSGVSSYPENMKDVWLGMGSSTSYSAGFKPTALAIDEITGNVYVGGTETSTISILRYKKTSNELLSVGTGTAQSPVTVITFLSIDPFFTSTDFGRLYTGVSGSSTIHVFDVMGTTNSNYLYLPTTAGNTNTAGVIPKKIALDAGHKIIVGIADSSKKLLEWHYQIGTSTVANLVEITDNPDNPEQIEDIAFDGTLKQFFVTGTSTVNSYRYTGINTNDKYGTDTDKYKLENVGTYTTDIYTPGFYTRAISVDSNDSILYILGTSTADELLKIKYSTETPTTFSELEKLPLGSVTTNAKQIVVDEDDDLIFILSEGANGTVTAVNARNERLQIMPVSQIGTETNYANAIGIDSKRNRVYIAEGDSRKVKMFEYLIGTTTAKKETWTDGYIQLTHNSSPRWGTETMLYSSNFQGDYNLMGTDTAKQFGTDTPILVGTGTPLLIVDGTTQTAYRNEGLFIQDKGTVTVRLAPDGVIVQTISGTGTVSGSVVAYDPASLFGVGTITDDVDGRGIRYGAMEFWIKFPRLTNPWAVPEVGADATDGKDNDGDGFIDDTGVDPASMPETNETNGIDDDGDGYVDDVVGLSQENKPDEIILLRLFSSAPIDYSTTTTNIFVNKQPGMTPEQELELLEPSLGTVTWFEFGAETTAKKFTVFSKLSLEDFETNTSGFIDRSILKLTRTAFNSDESGNVGTITVTGISTVAGSDTAFFNVSINPIGTNTSVLKANINLKQGTETGIWQNIAFVWETKTGTDTNKEELVQKLYIDKNLYSNYDPIDIPDPLGPVGSITVFLKDLESGAQTPVFHIGAKIFEKGTESAFMATIDDLVLYSETSSDAGEPKRFGTESGYLIRSFDQIIPARSRLGTISWTEYLPGSSSVSFDVTLKAMDGRIMERFKTGTSTEGKGTRLVYPPGTSTLYLVKEDATLEYRANLYAVGTQTESPVIDDVTITVIKRKPEIISIIER